MNMTTTMIANKSHLHQSIDAAPDRSGDFVGDSVDRTVGAGDSGLVGAFVISSATNGCCVIAAGDDEVGAGVGLGEGL